MNFNYQVRTQSGQTQTGVIDANSEHDAATLLRNQGFVVLEVKKDGNLLGPSKGLKIPFFSDRVPLKDKIIFTQQLAMMIKAGLPLVDAFSALEEQTENKYFSKSIKEIADDVKGGKSLSETIAKYPKIFNNLYIAIVKSGEKSGKLDEVLERLSIQLQKDYDLITKIKAAVTYPILVITALIGIVILMLIFVIPQLKSIFSDMGAQLPIVTRIVLGASDIVRNFWYIWVIVIVGLTIGVRFWARTPIGNLVWDKFKIRVPIIGGLLRKIYMARFTRTMGTLVASGLPMLDIIATVKDVINNKIYQNAFQRVSQDIENGVTLSLSLKKQNVFPAMIYHLVAVGEKSGKLDYVLLTMADFFDKEVETSTSNLATLVEPILILIIGAGVGLVVASVIMPIYSLVNTI